MQQVFVVAIASLIACCCALRRLRRTAASRCLSHTACVPSRALNLQVIYYARRALKPQLQKPTQTHGCDRNQTTTAGLTSNTRTIGSMHTQLTGDHIDNKITLLQSLPNILVHPCRRHAARATTKMRSSHHTAYQRQRISRCQPDCSASNSSFHTLITSSFPLD